eukprot:gene21304-27601_t
MKLILAFMVFLALIGNSYAQTPQGIPYQAVARNSGGAILASTAISVRFTIRDSVATGAIKYRETHSATTTAQGLFSVNVGQGTPVSGTFTSIKWGTNAKFMQVEIDPAGGSSYIDMGTQQMMSVPYALNTGSMKLTVSTTGDTLYSGGGNSIIVPGISAANTPPTIGMSYGGGKVAYILLPGDPGYIAGETHGLIAATSDQSTATIWGCNGTLIGSTLSALGSGATNTTIVSAACGAGTAARLCADLVLNGHSDWYLPSIVELQKLYTNRVAIGGFTTGTYWSSTEGTSTGAWYIFFNDASSNPYNKNYAAYVRAVRSF